ncbi:MAG: hypothetical protein ACI8TQ_003830 [Planctomycetota bacterium]|jgi:hypothetical protein
MGAIPVTNLASQLALLSVGNSARGQDWDSPGSFPQKRSFRSRVLLSKTSPVLDAFGVAEISISQPELKFHWRA